MWSQNRATQEAKALKAKKGEKKEFKTNSKIKMIKLESGEDDATAIFHPQRYSLRTKVWPAGQQICPPGAAAGWVWGTAG